MKIILKIFKNDLIGIKGSILTIVLAVGLCILPALYAWFNIFANGDPYANTGNINIAVVNLDKGSDDGSGNTVNMGQSVTDRQILRCRCHRCGFLFKYVQCSDR